MKIAGLAIAASLFSSSVMAQSFVPTTDLEKLAASLGNAAAWAAYCGSATGPVEAALERAIARNGSGPMEAGRLRFKFLEVRHAVGETIAWGAHNGQYGPCQPDRLIAEHMRRIVP